MNISPVRLGGLANLVVMGVALLSIVIGISCPSLHQILISNELHMAKGSEVLFLAFSFTILYAEHWPQAKIFKLCALLVVGMSSIYCFRMLSLYDFGVLFNQFISDKYPDKQKFVFNETMSPFATMGFLLAGVSIFCLLLLNGNKVARLLSLLTAINVTFIGFLGLMRYLFHAPVLYRDQIYVISFPTTVLLMLFGLTLLLHDYYQSPLSYLSKNRPIQFRLAISFLPAILLSMTFIGAIVARANLNFQRLNPAVFFVGITLTLLLLTSCLILVISSRVGHDLEVAQNTILAQLIKLRKHEEDLQSYASNVVEVQEIERKRIAHELHEGVIQLLGVALQRLRMPSMIYSGDMSGNMEPEALLASSIAELRRLTYNLRPSMLDDFGLIPAMELLCSEFEERNSCIKIEKIFTEFEDAVCGKTELALFRIAQELW